MGAAGGSPRLFYSGAFPPVLPLFHGTVPVGWNPFALAFSRFALALQDLAIFLPDVLMTGQKFRPFPVNAPLTPAGTEFHITTPSITTSHLAG